MTAAAARDRLQGARPIEHERLASLAQSGQLWGDIVAADAALDEGDLTRAHAIIDAWRGSARHPVLALRLGRLLRYDGKLTESRAALEAAAKMRPARIELALLDAETKEDRERALAAPGERAEPEWPWLEAYLQARHGELEAARKTLAPLKNPDATAPLSLRMAAALALGGVQEVYRADPIVKPLFATWPRNPDVIRIGFALKRLPVPALPVSQPPK